jgi:hypothetical protein
MDPRFAPTSGPFDMKIYRRNYGFLDEAVSAEAQKLKRAADSLKNKK